MAGGIKDRFVNDETRPRRILGGLAAGFRLPLNLRHDFGLTLGFYEFDLAKHFRRLVVPGSPAFDVGAGRGYYTVVLSRLTGAPVVAIEPEKDLCAMLRATVELNAPRLGNVHIVEQFIAGPSDPDPCVTLDSLVFEKMLPQPSFIKMDIEGFEGKALAGAERLLSETQPRLIVEVHGAEQESECLATLSGHGYLVRRVEERPLFAERRVIEVNHWLLAAHRDDRVAS